MDYKQKYEDAIERCKKEFNFSNLSYSHEEIKQRLERIFPELKESEDEKIRKTIFNVFKSHPDYEKFYGVSVKDILAWLEKQGEKKHSVSTSVDDIMIRIIEDAICTNEAQELVKTKYGLELTDLADWLEKQRELKPSDKVKSKFKVGDWCIDNEDGTIFKIVEVLDNTYTYKTNEGENYSRTHYSLENDTKLWTVQNAKAGDVLVASDGSIFLFAGIIDCACKYYAALSAVNDVRINKEAKGYWETSSAVHPATKEQCDLLFKKMKEAGYEWDANRKELKKIEKKFVWSKENNRYYGHICEILTNFINNPTFNGDKDAIQKDLNWLMSVKESQLKSSWSEEDEKIISKLIKHLEWKDTGYRFTKEDCLESTNWLKSIKEKMKEE